jgi:peroxiredoxin
MTPGGILANIGRIQAFAAWFKQQKQANVPMIKDRRLHFTRRLQWEYSTK